MDDGIDLGHGHTLRFTRWAPDDLPANRELYEIPNGQPMPVVEKWGAIIAHGDQLEPCEGAIQFDGEWQRKAHAAYVHKCRSEGREPVMNYVVWTVESWEPLTLSPSILCGRCKDHGFIRNGLWVPA